MAGMVWADNTASRQGFRGVTAILRMLGLVAPLVPVRLVLLLLWLRLVVVVVGSTSTGFPVLLLLLLLVTTGNLGPRRLLVRWITLLLLIPLLLLLLRWVLLLVLLGILLLLMLLLPSAAEQFRQERDNLVEHRHDGGPVGEVGLLDVHSERDRPGCTGYPIQRELARDRQTRK